MPTRCCAQYSVGRIDASQLSVPTGGLSGRVSEPASSEAGRESPAAEDDQLTVRLGRLQVAAGVSRGSVLAGPSCPCGRRCRSPGAPGCRRRRLVLRPARLKPSRRAVLREPRLVRPAPGTAGRTVFGAAAAERCSEFSQLSSAPPPAAATSSPFPETGAPVFAAPAESQPGSPPTTTCSIQHRQRRPASVDQLAGLVAQVSIMSSMAEMMYT